MDKDIQMDDKEEVVDDDMDDSLCINAEEEDSKGSSEQDTSKKDKEALIKQKLEEMYGKQESLQAKYLRSVADLDNLRKSSFRDREDAVSRTRTQIISDLLPVMDSFHLGLQEASKNGGEESVVAGFSMAIKQMESVLEDYGLQNIDPKNEDFDPKRHEAIGYEECPDVNDGLIVKTIRVGYQIKEHLVRPASVILSKNQSTDDS